MVEEKKHRPFADLCKKIHQSWIVARNPTVVRANDDRDSHYQTDSSHTEKLDRRAHHDLPFWPSL